MTTENYVGLRIDLGSHTSIQSILTFFRTLSIIIHMIRFLADWFPKQVINDKSTFLTKNWSHVSVGQVTIAMGLNCSLGLHLPKKFTYINKMYRSVLSHIIIFV